MKRLRTSTKIAYGIGQVGEQIKTTGFTTFVFFYFQQVLGLSGSLAGTAVLIALFFDAITDPIAGSLSDNWKSSRGRRHPFMYAAALPLAITWYLLLVPPAGLGETGLFLWLTTFAILVRSSMTLYHVPHLAMGAELTDDYSERTSVVAYRTLFGMVGGIGITFVGIQLYFPETPEYGNGLLNPAGYPPFAIFGAVTMFVTIWWSAWGTRSEIPRLPKAPDSPEPFSFRRVFGEFMIAWNDTSFRALFIGFAFFATSMGVTNTLTTHVNVFFWEFDTDQLSVFPIPFGIGFAIGAMGSSVLHRYFDKKPTLIAATLVSGIIINLVVVLRILDLVPDNKDPALFPIIMVIVALIAAAAGVGFTTAGSMMADVAQHLTNQTGKGQQGILFAATSFSGKLATGLGHFIAGIGIDLIHFPEHAEPGSLAPELIRNLGLLYLAAGGISFLGIYAYTYYRIQREEIETIASIPGMARLDPEGRKG